MDELEKDVNASQEQTVDVPSAEPEVVEEEEELTQGDIESIVFEDDEEGENDEETAEPQTQSMEENAKFANLRRSAEQAGRDKLIAEQFGEFGIKTEADYKAWAAEQKEQQERDELVQKAQAAGIDPDELLNTYEVQKENERLKTEIQQNAYIAQVQKEWTDLSNDPVRKGYFVKWNAEMVDLIDNYGATPQQAFLTLMNQKLPEVLAENAKSIEQTTIKKVIQNQTSSVGSATSTGTPTLSKSIEKMSEAEFKALREDVLSGRRSLG